MEETNKISLTQLMILLALSRMFTIVTYTPSGNGLASGSVSLIATLLSGVLQAAALTLGIRLSRADAGVSPMILGERGGKVVYRGLGICYWLLAMAVCLYTVVTFTYFVVSNFYDFAYWWVVVLALVLAAGLAVSQGLEAIARSAAILGVLFLVALGLVAIGLRDQYDLLNYIAPRLTFPQELLAIYRGFAMNFELAAFLLLLPWVRNYRAPKGRRWILWSTLLAVGLQVMTTLALGMYGEGKRFPIFAAVTTTRFVVLSRLGSVFMGIWVMLGFFKLALFLHLAVSLWAAMGYREMRKKDIWIHSALVAALGLGALGLSGITSALYAAAGAGVLTLVGVILLPAVGWIFKRKRGKGHDRTPG